MITKNNYENYIIDYWDGTLPETVRRELEGFLSRNPDIREQIEGVDQVKLLSDDVIFEKKNKLKRISVNERMDYYAIAVSEDVLTERERMIVEERADEHSFQRSVALYSALKMASDRSIVFPKKNNLYRRSVWVYRIVRYGGVAALLLILFALIYRWSGEEGEKNKANLTMIAKLEEETKEIKSLPQLLSLEIKEKVSEIVKIETKPNFVANVQNDTLKESKPELPRQRVEVMAVLSLERSTSVNQEVIIGPNILLKLSDRDVHEKQLVKRDEIVYALVPDLKLSDNVISNLIRVAKELKGRSKDKEYVFR